MDFIPAQPTKSETVPYYEDAKAVDGWQGQATTKSLEKLMGEVKESLSKLGGIVTSFQPGKFQSKEYERVGYRIHYVIETPSGEGAKGRLDIAALPVKKYPYHTKEKREGNSLRMALYMLRIALDGPWFLQKLSPGYSALVPFMLGPGDKTISELWAESTIMSNLLPPNTDAEFVEGDYKTVKQE